MLESFSARMLYVGGIGAGVAKLVNNAAGYAMNLLVAAVFTAGVKAGIGPLALWEAVSAGASAGRAPSTSWVASSYASASIHRSSRSPSHTRMCGS